MLDFRKSKKKFLNITMIDGKVILIKMPTKKIFDTLFILEDNLNNLTLDNKQQVAEIYDLTAEILSNNLKNEKVETKYLESINFDVEDVKTFFNSYRNFTLGEVDNPNSESPALEGETEQSNIINVTRNGNV